MTHLILASNSSTRAQLLKNAGLQFRIKGANVDERLIEAPLLEAGMGASDIAEVLAEAKAQEVSERFPDHWVIGADQTMSFVKDGDLQRGHKPQSMEEARKNLLDLRGLSHTLHSAIVCVKNGETVFRYGDDAHLEMRDFSPCFVGNYLCDVGEKALTSVGCYQLEGAGIQLFKEIKGDYFTILGLPLLPLLSFLRDREIIAE